MKLIDGKIISADVKKRAAEKVNILKEKGIEPCLAVIIVGDNPASRTYVNNKKKCCAECGIKSLEYALPESTTQQELLDLVRKLNNDDGVHGILCQLPLPKHIDDKSVINEINPVKDVDAFHPVNVGHITIGDGLLLPCTPAGIMEMLKYEGIDVSGKNCVIIGRSNIVGKPMALMLINAGGTVTVCNSRTRDLPEITRGADILVSAVGKAGFVTADMVSDGAVVIDVGMNRNENGKLCGDVDFAGVSEKCSHITPVPGGVGLMTVAVLMLNTAAAAEMQVEGK